EGVGLRLPLVVVDGLGPAALLGGVHFVDRDHLALLGLLDQVVVVEAPPRRGVDAEALAGVLGVGAGPVAHVDDAHLEDVARLGALDVDRAGADVHAEAFAGTAPLDGGIHRARAAAVHVLFLLVPVENAFHAGVALDQALVIVVGVVGNGLDGDKVPRLD